MSFDPAHIAATLSRAAGATVTEGALPDARAHGFTLPTGGLKLPSADALLKGAAKMPDAVGRYLPGELATGALKVTELKIDGLSRASFSSLTGQHPHDKPIAELPLAELTGAGGRRTTKDVLGKDVPVDVTGNATAFEGALPSIGLDDSASLALHIDWASKLKSAGGAFTADTLTLGVRIRADRLGQMQTVVHNLHSVEPIGWLVMLMADGLVFLTIHVGDVYHRVSSNTKVQVEQWHHITFSWDGRAAQLFVDGVAGRSRGVQPNGGSGRGSQLFVTNGPLQVGGRSTASGPFRGRVADLAVYEGVLDAKHAADWDQTATELLHTEPELLARVEWTGTTWTLVPNYLSLSDPGVLLVISPGWVSGTLFTEVAFAGTPFLAQAGFPDGRCELAQKAGTQLPLTKLLAHLSLDTQGWPALSLTGVDLLADTRGSRFAVQATVDTDLQLGPFTLREVGFLLFLATRPTVAARGRVNALLQLNLGGTIDIRLQGSHLSPTSGWVLSGGVGFEGGRNLSVQQLVDHLVTLLGASAPTVPSGMSSVTLESVAFEISTRDHIAVELTTASSSLSFDARKLGGRWDILLTASRVIGGATLSVTMEKRGGHDIFKGSWKEVDGGSVTLIDLFHHLDVPLPADFPDKPSLGLKQLDIEWDETQPSVSADAVTADGDIVFFIASKPTGDWEALGGVVVMPSTLSAISGLAASLTGAIEALAPEAIVMALSTYTIQTPLPALPNHPAGSFPVLGSAPLALQEGLLVGVSMDLGASAAHASGTATGGGGSGNHKKIGEGVSGLQKGLKSGPHDDLVALAEISTSDVRLVLGLGDSVRLFDTFLLHDVVAVLDFSAPAVQLGGSLYFSVSGHRMLAAGRLTAEPEGIEGGFLVAARDHGTPPGTLPIPMGLQGVKLVDVGVDFGVVFAPTGVMFGLQGDFHIDGQASAINKFRFLFEVEEEPGQPIPAPNPLLLSVYIPRIDLRTLLVAIFGQHGLGAVTLPSWTHGFALEALWLYFCEEPVALPDGTLAKPGIGFNGVIEVHGWRAHAQARVSSGGNSGPMGLRAALQADPVNLDDVLQVTGENTPAVQVLMQKLNGSWTPITMQGDVEKSGGQYVSKTPGTVEKRDLIKAGGPQLVMQTHASPYIEGDAKIQLFDISAHAHIEVGNEGAEFEVDGQIGDVGHARFDCRLRHNTLHAQVDVHIYVQCGITVDVGSLRHTFDFGAGVDLFGSLTVGIGTFSLKLTGAFEFEGVHLDTPELHIQEKFTALGDLELKVIGFFQKEATTIFSDLIGPLGKALHQLDEAAKEVEKDLQPELGIIEAQARAEAKRALDTARADAEAVAKNVKQTVREVEAEAKKIDDAVNKEVKQLEAAAQRTLHTIEDEVSNILSHIQGVVKGILDEARRIAARLEAEAKSIIASIEKMENEIVQEIDREVDAIQKEFDRIKDAIARWEKREKDELNRFIKEFGGGLSQDLHEAAHHFSQGLHAAGHWLSHHLF